MRAGPAQRLLRRGRQRGVSSSVIATLAATGVAATVGVALYHSLGGSMEKTGAGIGRCMAGEAVCVARQQDIDPGRIAEFRPTTPAEGSSPSFLGRVGRFGTDVIVGAVKGDFVKEPSAGHITGQILAGMTPFGWVGDARDVAAGVRGIYRGENGAVLNTTMAAVGFLPVVGDGAKALVRGGRAAEEAARAAKAVKKVERAEEAASRAAREACPGGICTVAGSCFAAGTPVVTPSGERPIETIEDGDTVVARDPETGALEERRVVHRFVTPDREVLDLGLEDAGRVEHLTVTPEHPFWSEGHGWTGAGELALGDSVQTTSGHAHVVSLQTQAKKITVYNFEVETAHTYFVGDLGAWVHNTCVKTPSQLAAELPTMEARYQRAFRDIHGRNPTPAEMDAARKGIGGSEPVRRRVAELEKIDAAKEIPKDPVTIKGSDGPLRR